MKQLVLWSAILFVVGAGIQFVIQPGYKVVSLRECDGPPPAMFDDESVTFQAGTKGVYRATGGRIERLSAAGDTLRDSTDDCYAVIGAKTYYLRESPQPAGLVVCENGRAEPVFTSQDGIQGVKDLCTDGSALLFTAHTRPAIQRVVYRDGKLTSAGSQEEFDPNPIKAEPSRGLTNTFGRLPNPKNLPNPFKGSELQHALSGDRYVCLTTDEVAIAEEGQFTMLLSSGDALDFRQVEGFSKLSVSGEKITVLVRSRGSSRFMICTFVGKQPVVLATSRPAGEFGHSYRDLSTNGDRVAVVESNGLQQTMSREHAHRLAFIENGLSRVVFTTGDRLNGDLVDHLELGQHGVSPGGSVAFRYRHADGRGGVAVAVPRRWDAMICGVGLATAGGLLLRQLVVWRRRREEDRPTEVAEPAAG